MSKLSPFGVALRKLRVEKGLRLFDIAEKLGKSTALLSAIETGRKPVPDMFILDLQRALNLNKEEVRELRAGKERTREDVNVKHLGGEQRELVAAFARRLDELPANLIEELRKKVLKSVAGEEPFRRRRRGLLVPPKSNAVIEAIAGRVRSIFCDESIPSVPIIEILEFRLEKLDRDFRFEVRERSEMDHDEGRVVPAEKLLVLREDVYDAACRGEARARFTACHELAHYVMHHEVAFSRVREDNDPIYRDAEWQADAFAGYLMMPRDLASRFNSVEEAAAGCGMSAQAAAVTMSKYR